jgi:hypothetical protein
MRVEDEHRDLLQNLEFAIVQEFRNDRSVLDIDARDVVAALVRCYEAEQEQRRPPTLRLADRALRSFDSARAICESRLGRAGDEGPLALNTAAEVIAGLKRIRSSIDFWNKESGRQGYLCFVEQHLP